MNAFNLSENGGVKLKPCPFCGGEGIKFRSLYHAKLWRVVCRNCDAGPGSVLGEDQAEAAWNRRHDETPSEFERLCGKENSHV